MPDVEPTCTDAPPVDRYSALWEAGPPDLDAFLRAAGPLAAADLAAVLRADQRRRWEAGQRVPAEEYVRGLPQPPDPDDALDLVYNEFLLREAHDDHADSEELCRRFPALAAELRVQVAFHQAVRTRSGVGTGATPTDLDAGRNARELPPPERIGRFPILGEIARGGMGVVYRAHDPDLDREVAVKVLAAALADRPGTARRFTDEARVTGRLQHPAIPPVHEVGCLPDGRPYLAMKLVRGSTLADLLDARPDPSHDLPRWALAFEAVCQAVGYAHAHGVIHRDLKPSNVMVGAFGEVQVMDWGLAKDLSVSREAQPSAQAGRDKPGRSPTEVSDLGEAEMSTALLIPPASIGMFLREQTPDRGLGSDRTAAGAVLGTPGYMAPEQARGDLGKVDRRADVFGLGGVLCAILTGQPPFVGSLPEVLKAAAAGDVGPAFERLAACGADGELVALAKRCLAADPAYRPADAHEVADALAAYRAGVDDRLRRAELETAAREAKAAELRKRRRAQAALGLAVAAVAGLIGFGLWWQAGEAAEADRRQAQEQADHARRRDDTEEKVSAALAAADGHLAAARGLIGDAVGWEAATKAALEAVTRAEGLLAAGIATDDLRARVIDARARAGQAERDRKFVEELDTIAFQFLEKENLTQPQHRYSARYRAAFKAYGLDPMALEPDEFARRVAALPHREAVWEALIDWDWHERDAAALRRRGDPKPARFTPAPTQSPLQEAIRASVARQPFWEPWWAVLANRWNAAVRQDLIGETLAELARKQDPTKLSPWAVHRAFCDLWNHNQRDEAVRFMRAGLERFPSDYRLHARLGLNLRHDPRPEMVQEALRHCTAAVALRPRSLNALVQLGLALNMAGQQAAGLTWIKKAVAERPGQPETISALAYMLSKTGKLRDAVVAYQEAIKLDPREPMYHSNLGSVLIYLQQFDDAIAACEQAIKLDPEYAIAWNNLGVAQGYKLRVTEAIASFRKALELKEDYAAAHYNLGGYLIASGEVTKGVEHLRRAQALDPKYKFVLPPPAPAGGPKKPAPFDPEPPVGKD